jgi:hypothetical protein
MKQKNLYCYICLQKSKETFFLVIRIKSERFSGNFFSSKTCLNFESTDRHHSAQNR